MCVCVCVFVCVCVCVSILHKFYNISKNIQRECNLMNYNETIKL